MIMDQPQLLCYFTRLAVDFVMPRLDIAALVDPIHTVNYQTGAPGFTRAGMGPSCDYCIDLAIRDGTHKEVKWSKELWICLCFFQKKKDACNSLCDFIVRFVGELWKMKQVSIGETLPEEEAPSPMQSVVLIGASSKSDFVGVPKGMQLLLMPLSSSDWAETHRAYAVDASMHFGVQVSDIYKFANGLAIPELIRKKVEPWFDNIFFVVQITGQEKRRRLFVAGDHFYYHMMKVILTEPKPWFL